MAAADEIQIAAAGFERIRAAIKPFTQWPLHGGAGMGNNGIGMSLIDTSPSIAKRHLEQRVLSAIPHAA